MHPTTTLTAEVLLTLLLRALGTSALIEPRRGKERRIAHRKELPHIINMPETLLVLECLTLTQGFEKDIT